MSSNSTNREIPLFDDEFITNAISINFSGRFKGHEMKDLGQTIINRMISAKHVDLLFGQQANFRLSGLPDNYDLVGSQRAFMLYNRKHFQSNDDAQYRHFLRDLELKGRLQKYYLPDANYTLCKMKCKVMDDTNFIAISWFTDENKDFLRAQNLLRKLLSFAANLCAIEEMPIIIAGSFRLPLDDIKQIVYNEFEGFRCYGYKTDKQRRAARMSNVYVSCPPLKLEEVKPVICGKIECHADKIAEKWRHIEDAFYWDPVYARLLRRSGASYAASPESPRAISPQVFGNQDIFENESTSILDLSQCPYNDSQIVKEAFPSAEDTLKILLAESERIKELVNEAETKARLRLDARINFNRQKEVSVQPHSSNSNLFTQSSENPIIQESTDFSLETEARKVSELFRSKMNSSFEEDKEFEILENACNNETLKLNNNLVGTEKKVVEKSSVTGRSFDLASSSPLRKIPSYIDLYDEELIETSKVCYMQ